MAAAHEFQGLLASFSGANDGKRAGQWPMARGFFYSLAAIQGTPTKTQKQFACVHNWGRKEGCERAEKEALSGN